jgi:hypothetical protein
LLDEPVYFFDVLLEVDFALLAELNYTNQYLLCENGTEFGYREGVDDLPPV